MKGRVAYIASNVRSLYTVYLEYYLLEYVWGKAPRKYVYNIYQRHAATHEHVHLLTNRGDGVPGPRLPLRGQKPGPIFTLRGKDVLRCRRNR